MRQIARPSQANNSLHLLASFWHCQCNTLLLPCRPPASTVVPFSTSSARHFLLSGKPDKKKHQQFVRRWQKRLLGDSEPIGAHVDPYDPTSPVRIAPEEQGEYEEVLDDDATEKNKPAFRPYVPARYAAHLPHVGGEQWQKRQLETDLAREFEKLTLRTYTPLSLGMANDIKELTGTWYTLMDDNLHMAQIVHDVTARPYTEHNFGLHRKTTLPRELRSRFVQAVAEIYTLKQAGLNMELSRLGTSGIYEPPMWIHDIRLSKEDSGEVILIFPEGKSAEQLLRAMREAPVVEPIRAVEEIEPLVVKSPEISAPVSSQEPPATIPEAPAFKRAALVTMDSGKRPFDFMSNRPVPRAKLAQEARMEDVNKSSHLSPQPTVLPRSTISMVDMASAVESSRAAITQMRCAVFEQQAKLVTTEIEALRRATKHQAQIPLIEDVKWQHVPVVDLALKFALCKRLLQLTGIHIRDPQIISISTLGDLFGLLCAAAKPHPTSLFSAIHVHGQKARERAKKQVDRNATARRKINLGDLIQLGNVELRRVRPTKKDVRGEIGLQKVVQYALKERGLSSGKLAKPQF